MKKVMVGLVLAIVLALSAVSLYAQQSVAGTWALTVPGLSMPMALTQEGDKVSGTIDSPHGLLPVQGEFVKGKLTLSAASTDAHALQLSATATVQADGSLSGTLSANQQEMSFTAIRSDGK